MSYTDKSIQVLQGLEPVRKRPGMYIGSTGSTGLHHLVWEIFDNSVDEVVGGYCNTIKVSMRKDGSIEIEDNGRGIPFGINSTTKISTIDTVFTVLHAGGKFNEGAYKTAGGLHGVGASVVNALSSWLEVEVKREGQIYKSRYENGGKIVQSAEYIGTTNKTGTKVRFMPDKKIFPSIEFNANTIKERIKESSFLYKNLKIVFFNEEIKEEAIYQSENGIAEYVKFINDGKTTLHNIAYFEGKNDGIEVEIAFQYTTSSNEIIVSFANSVKTNEGGSHETAFKSIVTEMFNTIARKWDLLKEKQENFVGDAVREGITAVISVRVPEKIIQYEGQTKNKLFTPEAFSAVKKVFSEKIVFWFEENRKATEKIIQNIIVSRDARIAERKAREDVKKLREKKQTLLLSGKLTPAQSKEYEKNELFLVEGNSAGGTAKLARDKKYQAILPLRGKVINCEKAKLRDLLNNEEICTIISCLGIGISPEINLEDAHYGKVIIMSDADPDGGHINTLLITFFYRFMKPYIEAGRLYVACPPLYKLEDTHTHQSIYLWNEIELEEEKKKHKSYEIQRYKGLGEMDANQLKETTMGKDRKLIQIKIEDGVLAEKNVNLLMGDKAEPRKEWINANINFEPESE